MSEALDELKKTNLILMHLLKTTQGIDERLKSIETTLTENLLPANKSLHVIENGVREIAEDWLRSIELSVNEFHTNFLSSIGQKYRDGI